MDFSRNSLELCQEYCSDFSGSLDLVFPGIQWLPKTRVLLPPMGAYCKILQRVNILTRPWKTSFSAKSLASLLLPYFPGLLGRLPSAPFCSTHLKSSSRPGFGSSINVSLSDRPCITTHSAHSRQFLPMHGMYSCWKAFSEASLHHLQLHQPLCNFLFSSWMLLWWKQGTDKASMEPTSSMSLYRLLFFWLSCGSCLKLY